MASLPRTTGWSFTDCRQCRLLCLGPTVLPCGHCLCRKCVGLLTDGHLATLKCPECDHPIPGRRKSAIKPKDRLPRELVLEHFVQQTLAKQDNVPCWRCSNKSVRVCLDCRTYYCERCCNAHETSENHVLQSLPERLETVITQSLKFDDLVTFFKHLGNACEDGSDDAAQNGAPFRKICRLLRDKIDLLREAERDVTVFVRWLQELLEEVTRKGDILTRYAHRLAAHRHEGSISSHSFGLRLLQVLEDCSEPGGMCVLRRCLRGLQGDDLSIGHYTHGVYVNHARSLLISDRHHVINIKNQQSSPQVDIQTVEPGEQDNGFHRIRRVDEIRMANRIVTINIDVGCAGRQIGAQSTIHEAGEVLLAKVDWSKDTEVEQLRREMSRLEAEIQNAEQKMDSYADKLHQVTFDLQTLTLHYERFILRLEDTDSYRAYILEQLAAGQLLPLIKRLHSGYGIRLLSVDNLFNFEMEADVSQWSDFEIKRHVEEELSNLLPERARQEAIWIHVTPGTADTVSEVSEYFVLNYDSIENIERSDDGRYTTRVDTCCNGQNNKQDMCFDIIECSPRRLMDISMAVGKQNTGHRAFIVALLMMPQGQLVMADNSNKTVKVTDSSYPVVSHDVKLVAAPLDMTQVNVDYVAVTTTTTYLYMVRVTGTPEVVSRVPTIRQYVGVATCADETLAVSCCEEPCCIDIITRDGHFIRRLLTSGQNNYLSSPYYLCVYKDSVLVSDRGNHAVLQVSLTSGCVKKLTNTFLTCPGQVASDAEGNTFIASSGSSCVLVISPSGMWRKLLHGPQHSTRPHENPIGICLSGSTLWVSWNATYGYGYSADVPCFSVVTAYHLV